MTEPGSSKARLAELDALRGIAAVLVMLFHYTVQAPKAIPGIATIPVQFPWGEYGVQLFFAISGFVIIMTLERTVSSRDFAVARFTRLFPAYWTAILLTTVTVQLLGATSLAQPMHVVAVNLTMLQGFAYVPAVDGAYWSLTVELAFYLCMWALWRIDALRHIEAILMAWIALRLVWWLLPDAPSIGAKLLLVKYIAFFAIGIAAYRVRQGMRTWTQQAPLLLIGLAISALLDGTAPTIVYLCTVGIFILLTQGALRFLDRSVLLWLGALSYPLYLIHQYVGYAIIDALEAARLPAWPATGAAILTVLALAHVIHEVIERPALRQLRWLRQARREATA